MRIAVIGAGIAGLSAAWSLQKCGYDVHVFESQPWIGGHAHTVDIDYDGVSLAVDTGFIVYNTGNYPYFIELLREIDAPTQASDMSFAVSLGQGEFEYASGALMAQRSHWVSRDFWRMIQDVLRFFRTAEKDMAHVGERTLAEYLADKKYSDIFIHRHILPMGAAIWSMSCQQMLAFPARAFLQFFHHHGLLLRRNRPQWRTITGGSRAYVNKLAAQLHNPVRTHTPIQRITRHPDHVMVHVSAHESTKFDHVVLACAAPRALALLDQPSADEQRILGALQVTHNDVWLHRDPHFMPRRRRVWSSWNFMGDVNTPVADHAVYVSYWMNRLQSIDARYPLFITLNPPTPPRDDLVFQRFSYEHPLYNAAAFAAQKHLPQLQGQQRTWYCGSYTGFGFHEDACRSGVLLSQQMAHMFNTQQNHVMAAV